MSTRKESIAHLKTAGHDICAMERFGAPPQVRIDVCRREARKADVVIVLIGPRHGSLLPQGISYTHAEFREAQGAGTPVLAFRIPDALDLAADERDRLASFVTAVGSTLTYDARLSNEPLQCLSTNRSEPRFRRWFSRSSERHAPFRSQFPPFIGSVRPGRLEARAQCCRRTLLEDLAS